jgi:hypothetical protein
MKIVLVVLGIVVNLFLACSEHKTCTLIGCNDHLTFQIELASGGKPQFAASLLIDGRTVACPAPVEGTIATCDVGVSTTSRELESCTSAGNGYEVCVGSGIFAQTIVVAGAPADVSISLLNGTIVVAQQDFHPHYVSNQPNGPGCDPICRQATETWTVP